MIDGAGQFLALWYLYRDTANATSVPYSHGTEEMRKLFRRLKSCFALSDPKCRSRRRRMGSSRMPPRIVLMLGSHSFRWFWAYTQSPRPRRMSRLSHERVMSLLPRQKDHEIFLFIFVQIVFYLIRIEGNCSEP